MGGSVFPSHRVQARPTVATDFALGLGEASICRTLLASEWLTLGPCGGLSLGVLRWRDQGFVQAASRDDVAALGAVSLRAAAISRGRGLFVALEAGLAVPFVRTLYQLTDEHGATEAVFQAAPVAGRFAIGTGVSFP